MTYTHVQFIGYAINTGPELNPITNKQHYVGILEDPHDLKSDKNLNGSQDIKARFDLLQKVLNQVVSATDRNDNVLKIFVIPEFFFRGPLGGYQLNETNHGLFISRACELVRDQKFKHWFFILGTAVFFWEHTSDRQKKEYVNYTLCLNGGFKTDNPLADPEPYIVQKELKSSIDFINVTNFVSVAERDAPHHLLFERADVLKAEAQQRTEVSTRQDEGVSIVTYQGINIGVEVCLDHCMKRLARSTNLISIPIQVVPSCGMWIFKEAIVATKYVFNCDGLGNGLPPNNTRYIVGTGLPNSRAHTSLYDCTSHSVRWPAEIVAIKEDVSKIFPCINNVHESKVHIYDPYLFV